MSCSERLQELLRDAGVLFEVQHHAPAFSAWDVAIAGHVPARLVAKVVIVFADGNPVMCVIPANERLNIVAAGNAIGAAVARLAHEDELVVLFPDCEVGAMPPFGNLYDIPVYVDEDLTHDATFYFQAGTHTTTMNVRYIDFARLVQPTVGSFAQHPKRLSVNAVSADLVALQRIEI